MSLAALFRRSTAKDTVAPAYDAIVAQARLPCFYADQAVPDTLDGRYEMIMLHLFLVLYRLRDSDAANAPDFGQRLFDLVFADMDRNLREIGVGDLSVGRQVRRMAEAFYGRAAAYQAGLAGTADLAEALGRNLYGTLAAPPEAATAALARYLRRQAAALDARPVAEILAGMPSFLPAAEALS